ncbi:hypothetical protein [Streptomyces violascens]|uniref:Uncharacterized protein n=1 Tax=Streptomyces violascens TaxID=67381 RepID=A0ABQ3QNC6_9ACTN|nr:hypothetical protein [Streptomyces violascens]GGU35119.1 hypothetical protein GCM10010289_65320 [Streptomyces violascens]GHI38766.1 hypothetical protein Sviol_31740 [Streptomyces violascens]
MSDDSFEQDVLNELGDDGLLRIAGLLGTDAAGAQDMVGTTVSTLAGGLPPATAEEVRQAVAEALPQAPPEEAPCRAWPRWAAGSAGC